MNLNKFKKKLSINIRLFKNIEGNKYSESYDKISITKEEKVSLKTVTFYHNIENSIYHLVYYLVDVNQKSIPIGHATILNNELLKEKYRSMNKPWGQERGIIKGVWGEIEATIDEDIPTNNYEICIFAKKITEDIKTLVELDNYILNKKICFLNETTRDECLENEYYLASTASFFLDRAE